MLFNLFTKRKKKPEIDFSLLGVDMHSHLIPGIDDGAQELEDSIALITKLTDLGFKKLITTPHVMADFYRNTPEIINNGLAVLRAEIAQRDIDIQIEAAAEYYLDEGFDAKLEKGNVLSLGGGFLLFEISFISFPRSFYETVEKIKAKGYKPVLAHPERYNYLVGAIKNFEEIKNAGCYLQLNALSLTGYYGKASQKIAEELVDKQLIDFMGTDLHHHKHADMLAKALNNSYIKHLLKEYPLQNKSLL
jgi:protein-tyrosine phosphatase